MSAFGEWQQRHGLPVFSYRPPTRDSSDTSRIEPPQRQFLLVGNRRIQLFVCGDGTHGLFDESDGLRWITAPGTGVSRVFAPDGRRWGTALADRPPGARSRHDFGPTWSEVSVESSGLRLERTLLCPEGEAPWVLVRVRLLSTADETRIWRHVEEWLLAPRFLDVTAPARPAFDVRFDVTTTSSGLLASETRSATSRNATAGDGIHRAFGAPHRVTLEALDGTEVRGQAAGDAHVPILSLESEIKLAPAGIADLWFRFGLDELPPVLGPQALFDETMSATSARLPRAVASRAPALEREVPWHGAILSGGASRDTVLGGHTLDQASAYSFSIGFNAAARDPLQHALPLVYSEPDLALSVLRNTCSWAGPDGEMPWALDGRKEPWTLLFQPSDQSLWALWLASEYAAATGHLDGFEPPVAFHPASGAATPVPLAEHLVRQFRFFVDGVGLGEHGHVRIRNADWNDGAVELSGVERALMIESGESVLNSAMAAWVLPVYAALAAGLGQDAVAREARELGGRLREAVRTEWNGLWFRRAIAPGGGRIGDEDCWLEVQPWALLCGAASKEQAATVIEYIDQHHRDGSPLGARVRWPIVPRSPETLGDGLDGGVWFSINMTLIWALARHAPDLAWDELERMTLARHTATYPEIWEGTLSGPDAFNAPESRRPGRTWDAGGRPNMMQSFPVNNLHSHAQPLLSYLRVLGVEPTADGSLRIGGGGAFSSPTLELHEDGSGLMRTSGPVRLETRHGAVDGRGELAWGPA